jgi:hypothetical protein
MKNKPITPLLYGLLSLGSLLIVLLGYVYAHKPFTDENLVGVLTALWQMLIAFFIIVLAGGIGNRFLKLNNLPKLERMGLGLALGIPILSIATLAISNTLGTGLFPLALFLTSLGLFFRKSMVSWLRHLGQIKSVFAGQYVNAIAVMATLIFLLHLGVALAPPTMFDALVYHFTLPQAYIQTGQFQYIPDNMFWGMPENMEMLYLLAMRFAGPESAALVTLLIGLITVTGMAGHLAERFGKIAAWTAVAALLAGETLTIALSSGYVEWSIILFGWAALVALERWFELQERKLLVLAGILCGAALGTKYTAGIVLLGCLAGLIFIPSSQTWKQRLFNVFVVGGFAFLVSLPWWIKNFVFTGNPFYPFFFPAGAMNELRLYHYQQVPIFGNWRSVVLLPWQATIWGVEARDGFSASIGAILIGLSPLAWIGWKSRTEAQKSSIKVALFVTLVGFAIWAVGSRFSGLLIQSRLFFGIFPAWALLAGVGMDSIWNLRAMNIRFGRVAGALVLLMFSFNLFATWTGFIARNPLAYVIRQEEEQTYLSRNLGAYASAVEAIRDLPAESRVLMLWEARGLGCWPKCDADEVIDRWYEEVRTQQTPERILTAWQEQGYTHVMLFRSGADYIREREPRYTTGDWQKLETLLAHLHPPTVVGSYELYSLRTP